MYYPTEITKGVWVVHYTTQTHFCCSGLISHTITIKQKEKPTQSEIEDAIRDKQS